MTRINTVRIPGLATGMDTDSMVKQMLSGEQNKVDKAKQKQQSVKWQQEIYRAVIKDVKDLQDKYFSVTSKDSIITSKAWNSTKVSSSNDRVMTATGSAGANNVDYNFEVKHLAKPASTSSDKSTTGAEIKRESKLGNLGLKEERKFTINFGKDGKDVSKEITINSDDTVDSLIAKINESTDGKVKASFSDMTGKLTIETNKTGESSKLSFISSEGSSTNPMDFLGLSDVPKGENAEIIVKSSKDKTFSKTLNEESNSFTIDGINYSVHAEGSADISSSQDVEPVVENMKKFVEDYNKIMDKVYGLVTEKKNKDFPPLTDAQKEDMKEEEIEKWEKKAKVGLLRNDSEMRTFMDHMQNAIFGENTKFLNECGLTSSEDYNKRGQISINEDKFRKALQNEGDRVYKAFAGNNNSVLEKMRKTMNNYVGGSSSIFARKAGLEKTSSAVKNYYSEQLKRQEDMIKSLQRKMDRREDQLYKQFGQLEASMNKLNSQMNYFAQA
ncbi:flagellar filament capping protein FliD [Paraclostridium sordellii]|uniref:flagellar filament capping protein FliD n=1 Tax=Paraclostridium sordellii TaxID=1505 RepID=UPI0005DC167A|nr:flagellar filament capping protein FliD [Paeniclostridium sordellii]CEN93930.1 flagellar cap protein [[Clostridium] sordellii] [Paeniclostridium sordellii]CEN95930.1 flagellar cap protein [[Clostridium] sordellii] [Paeniclostridium sordellii]